MQKKILIFQLNINMFIVILGNAASGKTTLSIALREFLEDSILINLDPANINSKADIDCREIVKAEEIAKKENLGPNGAILRSIEILNENFEKILEKIKKNKEKYYKIVDTPGQLEIFLYKDFGCEIVKKLSKLEKVFGIFVVDAQELLKKENFVQIVAQAAIISLKLVNQFLIVINKIDLIKEIDELKNILKKKKFFEEMKKGDFLESLIAKSFEPFYDFTNLYQRPIFVSALKKINLDELASLMHEFFCVCGDIE